MTIGVALDAVGEDTHWTLTGCSEWGQQHEHRAAACVHCKAEAGRTATSSGLIGGIPILGVPILGVPILGVSSTPRVCGNLWRLLTSASFICQETGFRAKRERKKNGPEMTANGRDANQ